VERKDYARSFDLKMDRAQDGRRPKTIPVVDEHTGECLAIEVERSISAEDVIGALARPFCLANKPCA
jgi:putative transposase